MDSVFLVCTCRTWFSWMFLHGLHLYVWFGQCCNRKRSDGAVLNSSMGHPLLRGNVNFIGCSCTLWAWNCQMKWLRNEKNEGHSSGKKVVTKNGSLKKNPRILAFICKGLLPVSVIKIAYFLRMQWASTGFSSRVL